jgi:hypothetical protein
MNTSATLEQLKELKLLGMTHSYEAILQLPVNQQPQGNILIAQLAEAERQNRTLYKAQLYLKLTQQLLLGSVFLNRVIKKGSCGEQLPF